LKEIKLEECLQNEQKYRHIEKSFDFSYNNRPSIRCHDPTSNFSHHHKITEKLQRREKELKHQELHEELERIEESHERQVQGMKDC
jgi:hypothetical protein